MDDSTYKLKWPWRLRLGIWLARWEPFGLELILIVLSGFLAYALLDDRVTASTNAPVFETIAALGLDTKQLGLLALSASALKMIGLFVCFMDRRSHGGALLRVGGLMLSFFIWMALGITIFTLNHYSVTFLPLVSWGLSAAWALLRFPAMPKPKE